MTRFQPVSPAPVSCRRHNVTAVLISFAAVSILYFNFDPTPAGADPDASGANIAAVAAQAAIPMDETPMDAAPAASAGSTVASAAVANGPLEGRMALLLHVLLLERGCHQFAQVSDYSVTFFKQERVDGALGDGQVMQMKLRHAPFSVYMKWLAGDVGRELIYVDGQNDGKMLVHAGGWKAKLIPALKLDPTGSLAMKEARYPVTMAGVLQLAKTMIEHRQKDLARESGVRCRLIDNHMFDERKCYCFILEWDSPQVSELYRKSIVCIDKERSLPVFVKNFTWPHEAEEIAADKLDEATLIEHYTYTKIQINQQLADSDFDKANKEYQFRR
jgi:hypothetical protein